jgi:WD40 repeat protein
MSCFKNENILKEIFHSLSLLVNKQLLEKLKSRILTVQVSFKLLAYENIFKSMHKHISLNEQIRFLSSIALLPDRNIIIGMTNRVEIYSPKNYQLIANIGDMHTRALLVLEDGNILTCFDEKIEIWGELIEDGFELVDTIINSYDFELFHTPLMLFNENLACCAYGIEDEEPYLLIFDCSNDYKLVKILQIQDSITALVNISDNLFASSSHNSNNVSIWNSSKDYKCTKTLTGHTSGIYSLLFYSKENLLISGSENFIKIWDVVGGYQCVKTIDAHIGRVSCLLLLPNGYFASGGEDKKIKLWDLKDYKCINVLEGHKGTIYSLLLLEDNRICSGSSEIFIWGY